MIGMSDKQLKRVAPAIFASEPAEFVSDKYSFVPTNRIIDEFRGLDFYPADASQVASKSANPMHAKHLVRLRHKDTNDMLRDVGDSIPEILLINAHGWQSSYQLKGAIFRMICSNGMIVADQEFGSVTRIHKGFDPEDIVIASKQFLNEVGETFEKVNRFQSINLDDRDVRDFGRQAARLRWDYAGDKMAESVLQARRVQDEGNSLWLVMNRCQENLIRGGYTNIHTDRQVRPITGITADVELNEKLWDITEQFAHRLN